MISSDRVRKNARVMKALTGISAAEFDALLPTFSAMLMEEALRKKRKRKPGGGRKGALDDDAKKLFFILFYFKVYPTFDVLGVLFPKGKSRSCEHAHLYTKVLEAALGRKCELPERQIHSAKEFLQKFPCVHEVLIDGMERPLQRPKKPKRQVRHYSGKKKSHRRKHIVMAEKSRRILMVTPAKPGRRHDKNLLDRAQIASILPPKVNAITDTGFVGMKHPGLIMPKKSTRKKPLNPEEKAMNQLISQERIYVEHAIGGMKRFGIMSQPLRNKIGLFDDRISRVSAGLWNFHLTCNTTLAAA